MYNGIRHKTIAIAITTLNGIDVNSTILSEAAVSKIPSEQKPMEGLVILTFSLESIYGFNKDTNCTNSTITNTICKNFQNRHYGLSTLLRAHLNHLHI